MNSGDSLLRLAAEVSGDGEPVIVIHGFTGSGAAMAPLIDRLDGWRRIAVDLPGHGRSPAPPELPYYSVEAMAESIAGLAAAVDGPCHVIGYSMGGRIALALAVAHPHVCRSLTLISATAGMDDQAERARRRQADEALADRIGQHGLEQFVQNWMAAPMWDTLRARLSETEWEASMHQRRSCDPVGLTNSLRVGGTGSMTPLWDRLVTLAVPTLVVCGELDAKFVELGRRMSERLPDSELAEMPGVGHAVHLETPDLCADTVADFMHRAP
ncbi:2-succinyl-6-hydroxy-2,4-cyclohexadiene-1-carboxylate synthase [Candidatus Poriferisodalis sp.]|uniref:2-succinyl-6-hydroxy-2, 4-cyclohexadiene-1-carboxylate synthase n=1 Tax=Candidatus Poriferisodalis sp. TaxID=3101277 RepID=UPI003B0223F4